MTTKPYAVYRYFDGLAVFSGSYTACKAFLKRTNGSFWLYVGRV